MVHIVAISGSLRKISHNTGFLRVIEKFLSSSNHTIDIVVPSDLPIFNEELETPDVYPNSVKSFRERLSKADIFLFATPEYNGSVSAALKNALDWGSRGPDGGNLFRGKTAGIISAAGGTGGLSAQNHLRDIVQMLRMKIVDLPTIALRVYAKPPPVNYTTGDIVDPEVIATLERYATGLVASIPMRS